MSTGWLRAIVGIVVFFVALPIGLSLTGALDATPDPTTGLIAARNTIIVLFEEAMNCFEHAEKIRPPGNDDAILRWNRCVRLLQSRAASEWTSELESFDAHDSPPV